MKGFLEGVERRKRNDHHEDAYGQRAVNNAEMLSCLEKKCGDGDHGCPDEVGDRRSNGGPQIGAEEFGGYRNEQGPVPVRETESDAYPVKECRAFKGDQQVHQGKEE